MPCSRVGPIRYDQRSYRVKRESLTCSLATVEGWVHLPFTVLKHAQKYVGERVCSADLCSRNGTYTLHVVVSLPDLVVSLSHEVIGVDLRLNDPTVASNRHFLGDRRGKSKSAKHHLCQLSGKRFRQLKDHDLVLSERIVHNATVGSTFVLENLTHIRSCARMRKGEGQRRLHSWNFAQFHAFLTSKRRRRASVW